MVEKNESDIDNSLQRPTANEPKLINEFDLDLLYQQAIRIVEMQCQIMLNGVQELSESDRVFRFEYVESLNELHNSLSRLRIYEILGENYRIVTTLLIDKHEWRRRVSELIETRKQFSPNTNLQNEQEKTPSRDLVNLDPDYFGAIDCAVIVGEIFISYVKFYLSQDKQLRNVLRDFERMNIELQIEGKLLFPIERLPNTLIPGMSFLEERTMGDFFNVLIPYVLEMLQKEKELAIKRFVVEAKASENEWMQQILQSQRAIIQQIENLDTSTQSNDGRTTDKSTNLDENDDSEFETAPSETAAHAEENSESDDGLASIVNLYTNGIANEKLKEAARVFKSDRSVNVRLEKMHELMAIPATISAESLGKVFGVSKAAIQKTRWYIVNRKDRGNETISRRHDVHKRRSKQYQDGFQDESFD